jgi:hypothetical protein
VVAAELKSHRDIGVGYASDTQCLAPKLAACRFAELAQLRQYLDSNIAVELLILCAKNDAQPDPMSSRIR